MGVPETVGRATAARLRRAALESVDADGGKTPSAGNITLEFKDRINADCPLIAIRELIERSSAIRQRPIVTNLGPDH